MVAKRQPRLSRVGLEPANHHVALRQSAAILLRSGCLRAARVLTGWEAHYYSSPMGTARWTSGRRRCNRLKRRRGPSNSPISPAGCLPPPRRAMGPCSSSFRIIVHSLPPCLPKVGPWRRSPLFNRKPRHGTPRASRSRLPSEHGGASLTICTIRTLRRISARFPREASTPARAPKRVIVGVSVGRSSLCWSPNGRWIVFHSHKDNSDDLWIQAQGWFFRAPASDAFRPGSGYRLAAMVARRPLDRRLVLQARRISVPACPFSDRCRSRNRRADPSRARDRSARLRE